MDINAERKLECQGWCMFGKGFRGDECQVFRTKVRTGYEPREKVWVGYCMRVRANFLMGM